MVRHPQDHGRRNSPQARLAAFLLGLAILWLAIGSPMDGFADALLSAHMVEHLLLMSFVPPLLLLGLSAGPAAARPSAHPHQSTCWALCFACKALRTLGRFLVTPLVAWLAMNLSLSRVGTFRPHTTLRCEHERWHDFEHICFLGSSILFWWPLIRPWPTSARYPGWMMLPYLVGADIVNTALSAFLAFCNRPVYSYYLHAAESVSHRIPWPTRLPAQ